MVKFLTQIIAIKINQFTGICDIEGRMVQAYYLNIIVHWTKKCFTSDINAVSVDGLIKQ